MRRGSPPCSPGALASNFAATLGDQLVDEAALATGTAKLLLHASKQLSSGLEHYAPALDPGRQLVPLLDTEGTAHRGGQDEAALGSDTQQACHSLVIMARFLSCASLE